MNFVIGGTNEKKLDFLPHLENKSLQKNSQKKAEEGGMRKKYRRRMAIELDRIICTIFGNNDGNKWVLVSEEVKGK